MMNVVVKVANTSRGLLSPPIAGVASDRNEASW
jgi:hypothetical protein